MRQLIIVTELDNVKENEIFHNRILQAVSNGQIFVPTLEKAIPFTNAKTLLGQEFPYAIYNMRAEQGVCLNLEAFAIVAGTIQANGTLYLLCPDWQQLPQKIDIDSLRWNENKAIITPNFYHYFQFLIAEFGFNVVPLSSSLLPKKRDNVSESTVSKNTPSTNVHTITQLTAEQQFILQNLPLATADIHLITAPRGRGKSTLSGKLAKSLSQVASVIITARSHSALSSFWKAVGSHHIQFIAPDQLVKQIETQQITPNKWLFIDEAASLPLATLNTLCHYFEKVVLTTTTDNYEGTGRGFSLKFLTQQLQRSTQYWQLTKPLRYTENDPLEQFITRLLLLDENMGIISGSLPTEIDEKITIYHLLTKAHYKTTPSDLRRLFDAPNQYFYSIIENQKLIASCWAVSEGGLDEHLLQAIWRGERRPPGNLVAQYLCFQGNLPDACRLRSIRISRLAVQPSQQQQGYGKRLVRSLFSQIDSSIDFISVSFGMNNALLTFWQTCGFQLIQITPTQEASSGLHSAMMIYPLSEQGKQFAENAIQQFERDLPLQPFYTELADILLKKGGITPLVLSLNHTDWQNLQGFAQAKRSFSSCYVSLKRLCVVYPELFSALKSWFETGKNKLPPNHKQWINHLREKVSNLLQSLTM